MRGNYFEDKAGIARRIAEAQTPKGWKAIEADKAVDVDKVEIPYPDKATIQSVVTFVAFQMFRNDLDYHGLAELASYHPTLAGLKLEDVDAVIREGLA